MRKLLDAFQEIVFVVVTRSLNSHCSRLGGVLAEFVRKVGSHILWRKSSGMDADWFCSLRLFLQEAVWSTRLTLDCEWLYVCCTRSEATWCESSSIGSSNLDLFSGAAG